MVRRALFPLLALALILSGGGATGAEEAEEDAASGFDEDFFEPPPPPIGVTIHLDEVELQEFLDALGAQVGQRWELAEGVDARVTVHADDEPWYHVFRRTLEPLELTDEAAFSGSTCLVRPKDDRERRRDELLGEPVQGALEEQRVRIEASLAAGTPQDAGAPWAGRYLGSNGFGWTRLEIGPDGAFVYQAGGCTGTTHIAWGRLGEHGPSRLEVEATFDLSIDGEPLGELVRHPVPGCEVLVAQRDLPTLDARWADVCPRGAEDSRILSSRAAHDPG